MKIKISDMDLEQIGESGQCFTWTKLGENRWAIETLCRYLEAEQQGELFSFSCSEEEFDEVWHPYFDLDRDYGKVKQRIDSEDDYLQAAAAYGSGIRILKQDLWEVMVSFMISQNNNISRIRSSIRLLCREFGRQLPKPGLEGEEFYFTFPTPEELSRASAEDFASLGLGYRAKYMKVLAERMKDGGLAELRSLLTAAQDEEARELLVTYYGIGRKVADCICLFGLHRTDMFPVDTHIKKIIDRHYGQSGFPFARYEGVLGIIQQYMFYFDLKR